MVQASKQISDGRLLQSPLTQSAKLHWLRRFQGFHYLLEFREYQNTIRQGYSDLFNHQEIFMRSRRCFGAHQVTLQLTEASTSLRNLLQNI